MGLSRLQGENAETSHVEDVSESGFFRKPARMVTITVAQSLAELQANSRIGKTM
jgi:hypothetical protein